MSRPECCDALPLKRLHKRRVAVGNAITKNATFRKGPLIFTSACPKSASASRDG